MYALAYDCVLCIFGTYMHIFAKLATACLCCNHYCRIMLRILHICTNLYIYVFLLMYIEKHVNLWKQKYHKICSQFQYVSLAILSTQCRVGCLLKWLENVKNHLFKWPLHQQFYMCISVYLLISSLWAVVFQYFRQFKKKQWPSTSCDFCSEALQLL